MSVLLIIGIIIVALWLFGFLFFRFLGWLVHAALIVGVIILGIWVLRDVFHLFGT